jgi:hypothetical protein
MPVPHVQLIIDALGASANACDQRKSVDLGELLALGDGVWRGRFALTGFQQGPERSLVALCQLRTPGLVWSGNRAVEHDDFHFALCIPHRYPLAMPIVRFLPPIPYSPHVVLAAHLPEMTGLPASLQEYIRAGEGNCCFMLSSQWDARRSTLAMVVFQISRVVSFTKIHGEVSSLNHVARDTALRLQREGRLPLGMCLPYPQETEGAGAEPAAPGGAIEDDIEVVEGSQQ